MKILQTFQPPKLRPKGGSKHPPGITTVEKFSTCEPGRYTGKYGAGGPLLPWADVALAMVDMVGDPDQFERHVGRPVSLLPISDD